MRSGIIGFFLGALLVVLALVVLQQRVIRDFEPDLAFHFGHYVFNGTEFPDGDFDAGRLVRRTLFPARFTTTFYNSQYQEVKRADQPGRYGVVVRMKIGLNTEVDQFTTLYRAPSRVFAWQNPLLLSAQLPEIGLDPAVLRAQAPEINKFLANSVVGHGDTSQNPDLAILLAGLSETSPADPPAVERTNVSARDAEWWFGLRQRIGMPEKYPHLVELPRDYDADPSRRWPLILYLVSHAEFGTDIHLVRESGLARRVGDGQLVPAIVVAPQCPYYEQWNPQVLAQLLDEVSAKYRVDPDRIYVTGGIATWRMAFAYPERFAAIIPIWCASDPDDAPRLKDVPVWAFDDAAHQFANGSPISDMVNAVRQAGGHAHLTVADPSQDVWEVVYSSDPVFKWLFAQQRGQPEVVTPGVPIP
jgi:hypothetical protein